MTLKCNSLYCPKRHAERYPISFNFQPLSHTSFTLQAKCQFPGPGDGSGYCGAEFSHKPNENAPHGINNREDVSSKQQLEFYECRGLPVVQKVNFISKSPWIIPFSISSFKPDRIKSLTELLPKELIIYGRAYKLAGFTMLKGAHFTAVVFWQGTKYYYDGIQTSDILRLRQLEPQDFEGQEGSYAFYFIHTYASACYCNK